MLRDLLTRVEARDSGGGRGVVWKEGRLFLKFVLSTFDLPLLALLLVVEGGENGGGGVALAAPLAKNGNAIALSVDDRSILEPQHLCLLEGNFAEIYNEI